MKKRLLIMTAASGILIMSSFTTRAALGFAHDSVPYSAPVLVSQLVLNSFNSVFNKATDIRWTKHGEDFYVSFLQGDITVRAEYSEDGIMLGSLRYYAESYLPVNILSKVKKTYPGKRIELVTEVLVHDAVTYYIQLTTNSGYIILRSDVNGDMKVITELDRS